MTHSHKTLRATRALANLTVHELARLYLLNVELARTEQWIVAHAGDWWRPRDARGRPAN